METTLFEGKKTTGQGMERNKGLLFLLLGGKLGEALEEPQEAEGSRTEGS